ncbi:hypothetical protein DMTZ50_0137 [Dehalococcoides mccartyi]|uniref:Uncharacterized protein n=1 Tax=Dehalococcoides mccartyi TaxID=61435 RepID=A0A142VC61_9CHLR|nr:hypothetical protein Dm11a5_1526 [Dehalococcoides mccartyi]MBA2084336.1 hypothetical protein [Dehalococcoides mccartyi]
MPELVRCTRSPAGISDTSQFSYLKRRWILRSNRQYNN